MNPRQPIPGGAFPIASIRSSGLPSLAALALHPPFPPQGNAPMNPSNPNGTPANRFAGFKVTKLRPAGPKPGQSQESFLRGKAQGDQQWDRKRERNFDRVMRPKPKFQPAKPFS